MVQLLIPAATLLVASIAPAQTGADVVQNTVPPAIVPPLVVPTVAPIEAPTPTPTPTPTPAPTIALAPAAAPTSPVSRASRPIPTPTPSAAATESPTTAPPVVPTPAPAAPPPEATPQPTVVDEPEAPLYWPWLAGVATLVAVLVLWRRRRRDAADEVELDLPAAPAETPLQEPLSDEPAPAFLSPRPNPASATVMPEIGYRPQRLGLNLISATVDGEVTVTNPGPGEAAAVRVRVAVLGAAAGHEEQVAAVHRGAARPVAPAFALEAGASRTVRAIAPVARENITPLTAGGRPMFVPLVAITVEWRDAGGEHRLTQAFAVGIERVDSPKLAPVWLDQDSRMYDAVAARPHGPVLR